jgi:hypothetical protein
LKVHFGECAEDEPGCVTDGSGKKPVPELGREQRLALGFFELLLPLSAVNTANAETFRN